MKKRLLTTLFTASLFLGSLAPAGHTVLANDGQGTITIQGTQPQAQYEIKRIFDATINGDAVSYTLPEANKDLKESEAFKKLFTVVENGGATYVSPKQDVSDQDIIAWAQGLDLPAESSVTEQGADGTEIATVNGYGYFLVKSSINAGAVVMVTSMSPNAIIQEKNSTPSWDLKDSPGGKKTDKATYQVGEEVIYTLDYKAAMNYINGTKVYQYVVEDTMPGIDAVDFVEGSVEVKVTDATGVTKTLEAGNGYTFEAVGANNFKIVIPWAKTNQPTAEATRGGAEDFYYQGTSNIVVTYKGVVKEGIVEGSAKADANKNTATINYNEDKSDPGKETHVYNGAIKIKKVDGANQTKTLDGAEFILEKGGKYLKVSTDKREWVASKDAATKFTTQGGGLVNITGLEAGTYQLIEIKAPNGYNLLDTPTEVVLTLDEAYAGGADSLVATPTIANNQGAELPSTGGLGTTIFYTLGAILVLGAGVVLVARRRLRD